MFTRFPKVMMVFIAIVAIVCMSGCESKKAEILTFKLAGQNGTVDHTNKTVEVTVPFGTELKGLKPLYTVSIGAVIAFPSGDFSFGSNKCSVTAENKKITQGWGISVTEAKNTEAKITSFYLPEQTKSAVISKTSPTIDVEVEYGTDLKKLAPSFKLSEQATSSPVTGATVDFSSGSKIFEVTAGDGSDQDWTVNVTKKAANTEAEIVDYYFPDSQTYDFTENASGDSLCIIAVYNIDPAALKDGPFIEVSDGATYSLDGEFPGTATCTVTAQDGKTFRKYTITVSKVESSKRTEFTKVVLNSVEARIDTLANTVRLEVAADVPLKSVEVTGLKGIFSSIKPALKVGDTLDFVDGAIEFALVSQDTTVTERWTIAVWQAESDSQLKAIRKESDARKGNGVQHCYKRQLRIANLVKWGYLGSLSDPAAIKKWIDWRIHDISMLCGYVKVETCEKTQVMKEIRIARIGVAYSLVMDENDKISTKEYAELPKDDADDTVEPTDINVAAVSYCDAIFAAEDKETTEEHVQCYEYVHTSCQEIAGGGGGETLPVNEWPPVPIWPADIPI